MAMKRFFAMIMALCICLSAMPLQALAAEETTTETGTETSPEGLKTNITTTTTTTTDDNGNTTVTVVIEKNTEGTTEDGINVSREESSSTTTTTNEDGLVTGESWEEEGTETKEWTEEDTGDTAGQPEVEVTLTPGETTTGTAKESTTVTDETGTTTTTTTDRTVTAETSDAEVTVNDSNSGLVKDQESNLTGLAPVYDEVDGVKEDKGGVFDYQFNSGANSKYADTSKWTDMPEDADVRFVGTGEHSKFYVATGYVVYEKDKEGNTVYDENGQPVIAKLLTYSPDSSSSKVITINGEAATELAEEISLKPVYDNYGGSRPFIFMLMDKDGNKFYGYCCDLETGAGDGEWYSISNLEDSNYYGSEESEEHIRSILMNGYWGTSDIPKEDGTYETGSLESIKQNLKEAINSGKMGNSVVQMPAVDADGNPVLDDEGNPVMERKTMLELIDELTAGEALLATQAAVWSYSNGSSDVLNGVDGSIVLDPDGYKWNHNANGNSKGGEGMDDFGSARVDFLYNWLINLQTEEESTVIINDKNFVEDMSLTVGDKVADHEANQDGNKDNDVYNADLNFRLAFIPGDKDDLLVQIKYTDLDGKEVTVVKRLAGTNSEGQSYEDIKPEADGSYVLRGLKLSENKDFNFDLRLEGTQYLENGVYVYSPVGGRDVSQTFVGVAEGEKNVDVSIGVTIRFDVDENNHVVAERKWHNEGDPSTEHVTPEEPEHVTAEAPRSRQIFRLTNQTGVEEVPDEEVPLAIAPKTGDMTSLIVIITMMAAVCLVIMTISDKKRRA